jgi:hypothetical protein
MYLDVLTVLFGWSLLFRALSLAFYGLAVARGTGWPRRAG